MNDQEIIAMMADLMSTYRGKLDDTTIAEIIFERMDEMGAIYR